MAVSRRTGRSRYTLVLLILTSLTIITLDVRGFGPVESARSTVLSVFAPVGDFASGVFRPVGDAWSGAFSGGDLKRENDDLKRQVQELNGQIAQGNAAQSDLEKLKAASGLPLPNDIKPLTAEVVSESIANFDSTIWIGRGSDDGVAVGMPVVVGTGLVGKIVEVSGSKSSVRLITERNFKVGVAVQGIPGVGIVEGQGDSTRVQASQFNINTPLQAGQLLTTASESSFPPGIPVGTIESVSDDNTSMQKTAVVKLVSTVDDLTYVTVLLFHPS